MENITNTKFSIETKIITLFGNDDQAIFTENRKYKIPAFQRPYEWADNEIESFCASIDRAIEHGEEVFMGTIQFNHVSINENENYYDIIDGQQRITTFILLLVALGKFNKNKIDITISNIGNNNGVAKTIEEIINSLLAIENKNEEYQAYARYKENLSNIQKHVDEIVNNKKIDKQEIYNRVINKCYFVELITVNMSLPKVVGIFHTINTTGLDLASSDMFKLQFYEFLKNKENGNSEAVMDNICNLYKRIDDFNVGKKYYETLTMNEVINAYKLCLAADLSLSYEDVKLSNEEFYNEIFNNKALVKKSNILNYESFERLFNCSISLKGELNKNSFTGINNFAPNLIGETRYSRYSVLPYVIAFFKNDNDKSLADCIEIFKYLLVNSVNFDKTVNSVNSTICNKILTAIAKNEDVSNEIKKIIKNSPQNWKDKENWSYTAFENKIKKDLYYNGKRAYLVCILSALLDEVKKEDIDKQAIRNKLFNWKENPYDIEHILAKNIFNDSKDIKYDIQMCNGIGNLVCLERKINRAIGAKRFEEKKKKYQESSQYVSVQEIVKVESWGRKEIEDRATNEWRKLEEFIFGKSN